jgi:hypothetical protein
MSDTARSTGTRLPWTEPQVTDLPRLTQLTLQTPAGDDVISDPIDGDESVFAGLPGMPRGFA